jgi:two-component system KDP operon response regulator KdpE
MSKRILIVEDDADVRLGYNVLLKANQYDTFFAADSLTALSEARKHQPDLIILDLGLPAGDGFIVMERLRGNVSLSMVPIIVVSARDIRGNKERALQAGAKAFVQKPWNDNELLALISQLLSPSETVPSQPGTSPRPETAER